MKDFGCGVIVSDNSVSMCFDAESLEIYAACCLRNFSLYSFRAAENSAFTSFENLPKVW